MHILLVEDDPRMRALVRRGLVEEGHEVTVAETGPLAVDAGASAGAAFDAIVLDVMLPGISGVEVVRRLRALGRATPVIMLTARDAAADVIAGLDAGADDYLTKPFSFKVLLARLRAIARRAQGPEPGRLTAADLMLDPASREVTRAGAVVPLTRTEFNLLECLMRRKGRVVTRQALMDSLWGVERDVESNTLDAFIRLLRQKVDGAPHARLIHTVRGVGYVLKTDGAPDGDA